MVGLSIVLEAHKIGNTTTKTTVINNPTTILKPSPPPPFFHLLSPPATPSADSSFLKACFFCRRKLLHSKDIYIYKGETAFCSEKCRSKHILMEEAVEEESRQRQQRRRKADRGWLRR